MTNKISDDDLSAKYQQRKQQYQSPTEIKTKMLAAAVEPKKAWWHIDLGPYVQVATLCSALVIAVYVIGFQILDKEVSLANNPNSSIEYQTVQLHVMESENLGLAQVNESNRVNYNRAYAEYVNNKLNLDIHHQTIVRVLSNTQNSDTVLQLITCDDELVNISKEVLNILIPDNSDERLSLSEGQMLALNFNSEGLIIGIRQDQQLLCT